MSDASSRPTQQSLRMERRYTGIEVQDLWDLWTTKEGFESWWGPEGFRVRVHKLEPRVGGELHYDMIAVGEREIAYMKQANMAPSHHTRATFISFRPLQQLELVHVIDFIPGLAAYDNHMSVEFRQEPAGAAMIITIEPHPQPEWTRQTGRGMESQLTKVPGALALRHPQDRSG